MNLKINIWTMSFYSNMKIDISILKTIILILNIYIFEFENCYFNCLKHYLNFKFLIWIWYLNSKLIFSNPKISISIQKIINWL